MSCRFQCALTKPSRHSFQPDKPSNPELHNENQKRLNDLLMAREMQDKMYSQSSPSYKVSSDILLSSVSSVLADTTTNTKETIDVKDTKDAKDSETSNYTPWTTPSAQYYTLTPK